MTLIMSFRSPFILVVLPYFIIRSQLDSILTMQKWCERNDSVREKKGRKCFYMELVNVWVGESEIEIWRKSVTDIVHSCEFSSERLF